MSTASASRPGSTPHPAAPGRPGVSAGTDLAAALQKGAMAVLPIEGAWVLAARLEDQATAPVAKAMAALVAAAAWKPGTFWLAPEPESVAGALAAELPNLARRLTQRLLPGPAIFTGGAAHPTVARVTTAGGPREVGALACSAHPLTGAVLARVGVPVIAAEIAGPGGPSSDRADAAAALAKLGIEAAWPEDKVTPIGRALPTVIEFPAPAAVALAPFRILRAGGYEDRFIRKNLALNILFVCTGNTCRSPMAEAIAEAMTRSTSTTETPIRIQSAGTAAGSGSPVSAEAITAVESLGIDRSGGAGGVGGGIRGHRARPLTRKLIAEADAIYTMSRSHLAAVLELAPDAEDKTRTLDPDGGDVPDPIGQTQDVYDATARRIMEMVNRRLKELGT